MYFMVLANPRSRTKWLSEYLRCSHDLRVGCSTVDQFVARLGYVRGTVETSVAMGYRLWQAMFSRARFVVVHRRPLEVAEALSRLGGGREVDWPFLYIQDRALWEASASRNTVLFSYGSLNNADIRCQLCEWIGVKVDPVWDAEMAGKKIEIDFAERERELAERAESIRAFDNDLARRLIAMDVAKVAEGPL